VDLTELQAASKSLKVRSRKEIAGLLVISTAVAGAGSLIGTNVIAGRLDPPSWVVILVMAIAVLTAARTGVRDGPSAGAWSGLLALIVASGAAWWAWTPAPVILGQVQARQTEATEVAQRITGSQARGTCAPASSIDLGVLASLGPWEQVCVFGPSNGPAGLELERAPRSTEINLTYTPTTPFNPDACLHHIAGPWWAVQPSDGNPSRPCPPGFTFQPGG